jgi:hypothetical protein
VFNLLSMIGFLVVILVPPSLAVCLPGPAAPACRRHPCALLRADPVRLAPEDNKAGVFGLYYLIRDCVVSLAALGGAFLWLVNPQANLWAAAACGAAGTLWFAAVGRDLDSRPPDRSREQRSA